MAKPTDTQTTGGVSKAQKATTASGASLRSLTVRGASNLALREAVGMGIRLIGVTIVVRIIGPANYGIYAAAAAFVVLISTLAQGGTEIFLIRMKEEPTHEAYGAAHGYLLLTSVGLCAIGLILSIPVASLVRSPETIVTFRVLVLSVPANVLWAPAQAAIERRFDYRKMGLIEVAGDVVFYVTAIILAFAGSRQWALVFGFIAWQVWLFVASLIWSGLRFRPRWNTKLSKEMLRHSSTYAPAQWLDAVGQLSNPIIVGPALGVTGIGYVAFANRLVQTAAFARRGSWRLGVVSMARVDENHRMRRALQDGITLQALAVGVPVCLLAALSPLIVPTLFGQKWTPAVLLIAFFAVAAILQSVGSFMATTMYAKGRNTPPLLGGIFRQVATISVAAILVPTLGLSGYGIAILCGSGAFIYLGAVLYRSNLGVSVAQVLPFVVSPVSIALIPLVPGPLRFLLVAPALMMLAIPRFRRQLQRLGALVWNALHDDRTERSSSTTEA